jgi:hypothetical protein
MIQHVLDKTLKLKNLVLAKLKTGAWVCMGRYAIPDI